MARTYRVSCQYSFLLCFSSFHLCHVSCRVAKAMLSQQKLDVASVRDLFEDALSQCGLHMIEGHFLWNACLDFEISLDEGDRDDERIRQVFSRFLQTPFPSEVIELGKERYLAYGGEMSHTLIKGIERAQRAYSLRQDYEAAMAVARTADAQGVSLMSIYYSYIDLEMSGGIHHRVRMMFERALIDFPTSEFLWKNLLAYEESAGRYDQFSNLHARAIRHCPWSGEIWSVCIHQTYIESRTASEHDETILDTILDKARANLHSNPLEYQKALLARAILIRTSDSNQSAKYHGLLRDGIDMLKDGNIVDPDHLCATLLSDSLAAGGDIEAGRAVWESLVSDTSIDSQYSGTWVGFYNFMEKFADDFSEARKVFSRGIMANMSLEDHAYLAKTWIMMEHKLGTPDSLQEARYLTHKTQTKFEASHMGIDRDFQEVYSAFNVTKNAKKHNNIDKKKEKTTSKRKRGNQMHEMISGQPHAKQEGQPKSSQVSKFIVFMKHIVPSVTEMDIKENFASCGDDMDVTIGRDPKTDRSKGYAYIRCGSKQTFDNLCALDGIEFNGKDLYIAPSAPPKGKKRMKSEHPEPRERSQKHRLAAADMVPRAAIVGAPKSNDDFRKMFLSS